ncbi:methyltransferase domain-containing protein [Methylovulum psychrotolerans]|uniref:Arsenite methyltransferase n=1 Tax=Methylovulum psychrotolerans TaxID=1704499 RepID=A0A1Z4BZY1_9GAMM|nr:methyltransferase domain-containing protein [Methylovulum psychrotolerans]ASF46854.1 methyltransferase [Methylovulum psychrotolerans]
MTIETSVLERYSAGAQSVQADLCCPVDYDRSLLALLPQEIIDKDYGCGDPSRYVKAGDVVLDLGSGSGKICYIAAQLVGDTGRVIGVDMNDDMLALARQYQAEMAEKLGSDRVTFLKGQIQDLASDWAALNTYLSQHPVSSAEDLLSLRAWQSQQRQTAPLIKDNSVDLVVSNCVLNLVHDSDKAQLIREIFRVVKPGGRVAISDIISDERVPAHLQQDPHLWSGCISGALQEHDFLEAFIKAGFIAVSYDKWESQPWQVVEGIEFRAATITAIKPAGNVCTDKGHAVLYRGPYSEVYDDEGHVYYRGQRMAVCERNYQLLTSGAYGSDFIGISPAQEQPGKPWDCATGTLRPVSATKNGVHEDKCAPGGGCC